MSKGRRKDGDKLINLVPEDGTAIGNQALRRLLTWDTEKYRRVRDSLVEDGALELGRGRGGSVRRSRPAPDRKAGKKRLTKTRGTSGFRNERELYAPFEQGLKTWAADQGWSNHHIEKISDQGRRKTGGTWTRPDFVVVGVAKYDFTPGTIRDVETFEVKFSDCGIESVFEVAAHSRFATKSYLAILKDDAQPFEEDHLARIESECQRLGLGLILFKNPADVSSWEYKIDPVREEPDPAVLDEFMKKQVKAAEQLRKLLH